MSSSRSSWVRRLCLLVLVGAASVPLLPGESPACSTIGPDLLELRGPDTAEEGEAPGPTSVRTVGARRGHDGSDGCSGGTMSSCDDIGTLNVTFEPASDPDSPAEEVGYVFTVVEGTAPGAMFHPDLPPMRPAVGDDPASLALSWVDGATDEQEPLRFSITIQAVDVDGHLGPVSEPFEVDIPGT